MDHERTGRQRDRAHTARSGSKSRPRPLRRLLVLVPAHDEAALITATVESVVAQLLPGDRVVVVADNCTDETVPLARAAGADVFVTADNTAKKAGALNQALQAELRGLHPDDGVLVMDADTTLHAGFLAAARRTFATCPVSAVGGVFSGDSGGGLVGLLQRNEYARYSRQLRRTGRVWVLTGTGTVFRAGALRHVMRARARGRLPGGRAQVYDTLALTEDNELTLALKSLGHAVASPSACGVTTEVMPSLGRLWQQRLRWQRGAIDNLRHYGWTPTTRPYVGQQVMMGLGVLMLSAYLMLLAVQLATSRAVALSAFWACVSLVFVLERVLSVRTQGWRAMAVASVLVVEMAYDAFLQAVLVRSAVDSLQRREARWGTT